MSQNQQTEEDIRVTSQPVDEDGNIVELDDENEGEEEVDLPPMRSEQARERMTPPLKPRGGGGDQEPPQNGEEGGGDDGGEFGPLEPPSPIPGRRKTWLWLLGAAMLGTAWWWERQAPPQ